MHGRSRPRFVKLEILHGAKRDDLCDDDTTPRAGFWRGWFARNPDARFDAEEVIVSGNRAVVRWVYCKMRSGQPWHLRGVDVSTVRDGKVAAKLAYVKG